MAQCRNWVFTIHQGHLTTPGQTLDDYWTWIQQCGDGFWDGVKWFIFQKEIGGNTNRLHLQGAVCCSVQRRATTMGNQFKVKPEAFQKMRGAPSDSLAYCTKGETRVAGTTYWQYGDCPGGQGSKLKKVAKIIKESGLKAAIREFPETYITNGRGMKELNRFYKGERERAKDICVIVVFGTPGCGKSHWAKRVFAPDDTFTLPAVSSSGQAWFDGYDGERVLLIDEFSGRIEFELFKNMLDPYPMMCPVKGDYVHALWDTVVITTNYHPNTWYPNDKDAWGTSVVSPIQRRIHVFIEGRGRYELGTAEFQATCWDVRADNYNQPTGWDFELPVAVWLQEGNTPVQSPVVGEDEGEQEVETAPTQEIDSDEALLRTSVAELCSDDTLENLMEEWEERDNTFSIHAQPFTQEIVEGASLHAQDEAIIRGDFSDDDDDEFSKIIYGEDGDEEPRGGINL